MCPIDLILSARHYEDFLLAKKKKKEKKKIKTKYFLFLEEQWWRSVESIRLPATEPGFDSQIRCLMWVEFVGSLLCIERFFSSGTPVLPST